MSATTAPSATLAAALDYAKGGLPIFPVNPQTKRPLTAHGFRDATTDPDRIGRWWRQWPDAGVAVPTGQATGLLVLDADGQAGADTLAALEAAHGPLPATVVAKTPRGEHTYLRHPGGHVPCSAGKLDPGLDIRADGGYVVVPPGPGREWEASAHPDDVRIADAPAWLVAMIVAPPTPATRPPTDDQAPIPAGQRNTWLTSLAGRLRRDGLSEEAMAAALLATNGERCRPPLPDAEVRTIARSVARYPIGELPPTPTPSEEVAQLRDQLAESRAETAALREDYRRLRADYTAVVKMVTNPHLKHEAPTLLRTAFHVLGRRQQGEPPDESGFLRVSPAAIGEDWPPLDGRPAATPIRGKATVLRHLRSVADRGLPLRLETRRAPVARTIRDPQGRFVYDEATGRPRKETITADTSWLAWSGDTLSDLLNPFAHYRPPADAPPRPTHGGKRIKRDPVVCPHCGGDEFACRGCGAALTGDDLAAAGHPFQDETLIPTVVRLHPFQDETDAPAVAAAPAPTPHLAATNDNPRESGEQPNRQVAVLAPAPPPDAWAGAVAGTGQDHRRPLPPPVGTFPLPGLGVPVPIGTPDPGPTYH